MAGKGKVLFPFGDFLKQLREKKGASLRDVQKATDIPIAYLSQLETGARKKIPVPDRLKALANFYNVTIQELLAKAGYYEDEEIEETYEQKINKMFLHIATDPDFSYGTRLKGKLDLETKRFIIEMYEKLTDKKIPGN